MAGETTSLAAGAAATLGQLGRYRLVRVLGQGAMGVVYEGVDPALGRQVAVKTILRSALHDADTAADTSARFVREAQAVARLSHPHIVMVFDFGEEGDVAYFVMEFVRGSDLKTRLDDGERFPPAETVRIVGELLAALDFAHRHGVVHRDVKPANVMLDAAGHVKLTDFGVARLADTAGERTLAGTMVGTPSYMSPEQILGQPVGSRTDLFAAGIILYQCLTGQKPFRGPGTWAVQQQIVQEDPAPPSTLAPGLAPAFDAVVARALAKEPAARFGSAGEFAEALQAALAGQGESVPAAPSPEPARPVEATLAAPAPATAEPTLVEAPPVPPAQPATPHPRSRRAWLGLGGLAAAAAVAAAVVWLRPAAPLPEAAPAAPAPATTPAAPALPAPVAAEAPPPAEKASVPAPVAKPEPPAAATAPPAKPTVRTARAESPARPPVAGKAAKSRCDDLLQRFQLGDALSPEELNTLQKECR